MRLTNDEHRNVSFRRIDPRSVGIWRKTAVNETDWCAVHAEMVFLCVVMLDGKNKKFRIKKQRPQNLRVKVVRGEVAPRLMVGTALPNVENLGVVRISEAADDDFFGHVLVSSVTHAEN